MPEFRALSNFTMLMLASFGGLLIGTAVAGVRTAVGYVQTLLFGMDINSYGADAVAGWRIMAVTLAGGLFLGWLLVIAGRFNKLAIVDPVEANALEGGKMSFNDSIILVGLSIVSITIGGSVGFEAAMTQLGAGTLSAVGQKLKLGRRDLRILVSAGTGAGLAAIFGAPLAGAFYALELVIGGYAMRALMPTIVASALSSLMIFILIGNQLDFPVSGTGNPTLWHFPLALLLGFCAAIVGITVMRGTTSFDDLLKKIRMPAMLKPLTGAALLGLTALIAPEVMGPSHAGIKAILAGHEPVNLLALLLLCKIIASIACVGSGFRGGLFSASLFLGAAMGCLIYNLLITPLFGSYISLELCVIAGMAGVATSIIGTPIGIVLLMIETAGLHTGVVTVAITAIIASHFTRQWFGFSFSTWRFHIRGNGLSGPQDIGRLRALKFSDLNLEQIPRINEATPLKTAAEIAVNQNSALLAVNKEDSRFAGLVWRHRLLEEITRGRECSLSELLEKPKLVVEKDDAIAPCLDSLNRNINSEVVVLDQEGRLYGLASEAEILLRYLSEIQAAVNDEVELKSKI
ncbi:chloride channel protein [Legionella dresdenensis]|uniref:Chloride channel protein n=1 Tax=Legionella dresdenensis TaxID=450200 RepID=A0ABV8CCG5_9GAMM